MSTNGELERNQDSNFSKINEKKQKWNPPTKKKHI